MRRGGISEMEEEFFEGFGSKGKRDTDRSESIYIEFARAKLTIALCIKLDPI